METVESTNNSLDRSNYLKYNLYIVMRRGVDPELTEMDRLVLFMLYQEHCLNNRPHVSRSELQKTVGQDMQTVDESLGRLIHKTYILDINDVDQSVALRP